MRHQSDSVVNVHDLGTFALKMSLQKTKGANLFAVDTPNEQFTRFRMCVSCKKKLLLYEWQMGEFIETRVKEPPLMSFPGSPPNSSRVLFLIFWLSSSHSRNSPFLTRQDLWLGATRGFVPASPASTVWSTLALVSWLSSFPSAAQTPSPSCFQTRSCSSLKTVSSWRICFLSLFSFLFFSFFLFLFFLSSFYLLFFSFLNSNLTSGFRCQYF